MLQLILGPSGSGKSVELRKSAFECKSDGVIIIVPEQNSFDTEKTVFVSAPADVRRRLEVLSFSRLCNNIFRKYGGLAGDYISDSGKCMLMSIALDSVKENLKIYRNYVKRPEFIKRMTAATDEFKNAGLTPQGLAALCEGRSGAQADKLRELYEVYAVYQSLVETRGLDSRDDLLRAARMARENEYFKGKSVFIDGFKDFTGAQKELVELMMSQCDMLTVSLCSDSLDSDSIIFSSPNRTARCLIREANKRGITVKAPITLHELRRFKNEELKAVSENFLRGNAQISDAECENVSIYHAKSPRDEAEYIAASISQLVKTGGFRYRDIAVVSRDGDSDLYIDDSFLRYDIPFYSDKRDSIGTKPIVKLIAALVSSARHRNDTDSIFTMLKSPYSPFDVESVCRLENYCFIWGITGEDMRNAFTNHPFGLGKDFDEKSRSELHSFNQIREKIIFLTDRFSEKTKSCDGEAFAQAVYEFIKDFGVEKAVRENPADGEAEVYNCTVDCLEQMAVALKGMNFELDRMEALLRLALADSDYGRIPQRIDEVTVGTADRIRYNSPKAVFVFGAADGRFPALIKNDAVIGWAERAFLRECGVEISDGQEESYADERYFAYMAVSAASEKLFVSFPSSDMTGGACFKSLIVSQIENILPKVKYTSFETVDRALFLQTRQGILHEYAESFLTDRELKTAVEQTDDGSIARLNTKACAADLNVQDVKIAAELFGRDIKLSASQVESFYRCRFSYFCEKGLRIRPLERVEMNPLQSGSFIHYCLYRLLYDRTKQEFLDLSDVQLSALCDEIAQEYLNNELSAENFTDRRFIALMMRIKSTVKRLAKRLQAEFSESDFIPVEFEARIAPDAEIKPLSVKLSNGSSVRIEGAVDRIDMLEKDGQKYIRVVDYKSGNKEFKLEDVQKGLNIQMLLYLFAVCDENGGKYAGAQPAGILYMPVGDSFIKADSDIDAEAARQALIKMYRMNGLVLNDASVVRAMENGGAGVFVPVKFKKDGSMTESSLATAEEFAGIRKTIDETLAEMARLLQSGRISPSPTDAKGYRVCDYCRYADVCGSALQEDNEE